MLLTHDTRVRLRRVVAPLPKAIDQFGEHALFYAQSIRQVPLAVARYRRETVRPVAEMTLGDGRAGDHRWNRGRRGVSDIGLRWCSRGAGATSHWATSFGIEALTGVLVSLSECEDHCGR